MEHPEYNEETRLVKFPEVEEGVSLLYTWPDCLTLKQRLGKDWFNGAADKLNEFDIELMEVYLQVGGKKAGKARPLRISEMDGKINVVEVARRILDALYLSVHSRTFADHFVHVMEGLKKAGPNADPQLDPGTFFPNLRGMPSGSESNQASSTGSPPQESADTSKSGEKA